MLVQAMSRPETITLSRESAKEYFAFGELFGETMHYKPIGHMTVATPVIEKALREEIKVQERMQVPIEVLDPQQIKEIIPTLEVEDLVLGAAVPDRWGN